MGRGRRTTGDLGPSKTAGVARPGRLMASADGGPIDEECNFLFETVAEPKPAMLPSAAGVTKGGDL